MSHNENAKLRKLVEQNLGEPVLALLEVPTSDVQQKRLTELGLKEGEIIEQITSKKANGSRATWSAYASFPPDVGADIDGELMM